MQWGKVGDRTEVAHDRTIEGHGCLVASAAVDDAMTDRVNLIHAADRTREGIVVIALDVVLGEDAVRTVE